MLKPARCLPLLVFAVLSPALSGQTAAGGADDASTQTLRFVQDDAQDYMVSKIYRLKYIQANDITPFVMGIVMRYNMNHRELCGVRRGQRPNADRDLSRRHDAVCGRLHREGRPEHSARRKDARRHREGDRHHACRLPPEIPFRPGAAERAGRFADRRGVYGSVYAWDHNSNQIYWKDNSSNTQYVYQFLGYLDRPAPQITLTFQLYEVRESTFRDLGIEYLAWKNGPGMNIFQVGFDVINVTSAGTAALNTITGPVGGFLAAPRVSNGGVVKQVVSLPHGRDTFVIGGLTKQEEVESRTGVPWLMDIPVLGYLFSSVSNSVKHTELVVMAQCEWDSPADKPDLKNTSKAETRGAPMAVPVMPAQNIPADVPQPQI